MNVIVQLKVTAGTKMQKGKYSYWIWFVHAKLNINWYRCVRLSKYEPGIKTCTLDKCEFFSALRKAIYLTIYNAGNTTAGRYSCLFNFSIANHFVRQIGNLFQKLIFLFEFFKNFNFISFDSDISFKMNKILILVISS